jgi:hypothetical protein
MTLNMIIDASAPTSVTARRTINHQAEAMFGANTPDHWPNGRNLDLAAFGLGHRAPQHSAT